MLKNFEKYFLFSMVKSGVFRTFDFYVSDVGILLQRIELQTFFTHNTQGFNGLVRSFPEKKF